MSACTGDIVDTMSPTVLANGIDQVKLQTNALSLLEAPAGNEEDHSLASEETRKPNRSRHRTNRSFVSANKTPSHSSLSSDSSHSKDTQKRTAKVDLSKLGMTSLWKYVRHYNIVDVIKNPSKEQLVDAVERHFMSQQLDEFEVITGFVKAAKRRKKDC